MKHTLTAITFLMVLCVTSCRPKDQGPQDELRPPPQQSVQSPRQHPGTAGVRTGTVQEVIQASAYTYLHIKNEDGRFWVAVTKREMEVGQTVSFADALEMKNFDSKDLQRTFETIYFVNNLNADAQPGAADRPAGTSPHAKAMVERLEISLERANGGITIGELFSNRQSCASKAVRIRGQVTKVNRAIMGKNWVHLQDGTSDAGNYDLTITTIDDATPGEIVTFEGQIVLNKDFGSGYAYDVLMEEARKQSH